MADSISLNLNVFVRSLMSALGVLVFMLLLSWELTLVTFISVPFVAVVSKVYGGYIQTLSKAVQAKLAEASGVADECFASIRTVRSFATEAHEVHQYKIKMDEYYVMQKKQANAYFVYAMCYALLPQLVTLVVIIYGGKLVLDPSAHFSGGNLVSFLLYLQSLTSYFNSMGDVYSGLAKATGASEKVFELIQRPPARKGAPLFEESDTYVANLFKLAPASIRQANIHQVVAHHTGLDAGVTSVSGGGSRVQGYTGASQADECLVDVVPATALALNHPIIALENVHLTYPARPLQKVLKGINIEVRAGEVVALVGPSGGGKSSVVSLIEHFYEPDSGIVRFRGKDINVIPHALYHSQISLVQQEPTVFARSILRNIIYGMEGKPTEPSRDDIETAAKLANAHDFISALPNGYDTEVGERGVQLSGGQKQRSDLPDQGWLFVCLMLLVIDHVAFSVHIHGHHFSKGSKECFYVPLERLLSFKKTQLGAPLFTICKGQN
eukprot:c8085_g1_i1.p1 GENE.c8085_g1_i1~~c8085_g1_i1.p1  ORF type:complete len:540 (+),score=138.25 c8085_g1_i1:134-1621(+)